MTDPVIASDGNTYDRIYIENWFENNDTSPITNEPLDNKNLIPNRLVRDIINIFSANS